MEIDIFDALSEGEVTQGCGEDILTEIAQFSLVEELTENAHGPAGLDTTNYRVMKAGKMGDKFSDGILRMIASYSGAPEVDLYCIECPVSITALKIKDKKYNLSTGYEVEECMWCHGYVCDDCVDIKELGEWRDGAWGRCGGMEIEEEIFEVACMQCGVDGPHADEYDTWYL